MSALNLDTYSLSLITAKEDILSDRTSTDWAVFTYEKKWSLKLLDSGVGGLEELIKKLNKNLTQYGLCRVSDPSSGVRRVILIHWVGDNVDAFQREATAHHLPSIRKLFKEADVLLGAQKMEDITQELVAQALSRVPPPARASQKPRTSGAHEVVGTKYLKTNPAVEMKISKREAFWQRSEREEERRKEMERLRLQEERIALERERIERERQEEEVRERRIQEKERLVEAQRKDQARLEAERRRLEKERWAQQQKEYEEELKGRFKRSQSIEMAAEAAALVSSRSLHPRDFFRQQERSVSGSFSPPSTPSSPSKFSSGFFNRTTLRYQRSMTESILTPTSRSPILFQGFQKRDSFSSTSASSPQTCSPAFIFSKSSLPVPSPKVDSLPSFIPPPITAIRVTPTQVKGTPSPPPPLHTPPRTGSEDLPFRAEYVTVSPAEHNAAALNSKAQARPQHQGLHSEDTSGKSAHLYRAELVAVNAPSTSPSEVQELPNKIAKSPTNFTAIKSVISFSPPLTEVAFTSPAPITEAKIPDAPQSTEKVLPTPPSAFGGVQPTTAAEDITPPTPASQVLLASSLSTQEGINKTSKINLCSDETVMSTDLALSHEPKRSSGSTSLVSLLAPIPYTPYRTQRTDSSSLRSSSSAVPLSQHALLPSLEIPPLVTFSIPSAEALPGSAVESSKISLESKYPALGKVTQNSSTTTSPVTVSVCSAGDSAESRVNIIHSNILIPESSSWTVPIEISAELQSYAIQADDFLPEPSPISSSLPTKSCTGPQLYNIHADIPLVESSHEPPSITTLSTYGQLNVQADIPLIEPTYEPPSITTGTSSGQLNFQVDTPGIELSHEPPSKTTEGSSGQLNNQAAFPLLESSSGSSCITSEDSSGQPNVQADILLTELSHELPSKTTKGSSCQLNAQADVPLLESSSRSSCIITEGSSIQINAQSDILLLELACEPPSITTEGSSGPLNVHANFQLMQSSSEPSLISTKGSSRTQLTNIQTDIPLLESSSESSCITTEGSFDQLNVLANSPLVEPTYKSPSITTEGSSTQLNFEADIRLMKSSSESSWITIEGFPGPQLNNIQADIPLLEHSYESPSITTEGSSGQLNVPVDIPSMRSSSEPSQITSEGSSGPQFDNIYADIQLIELSHGPPSIISESSSGQINIQADIQIMESSSESSWITTEGSSGPPNKNNIQADIPFVELSYEPPSKTTEGLSDQLNVQAYMPVMDCPSEPLWISSEGSSGPQVDNMHANIPLIEIAHEPSSIITEGSSGQINIQADIQIMESSSESSWITTEDSSGPPNKNNIQADIPFVELSYEPLSKTTEGPSDQLNVQAYMPVMECPSEPSWITSEGSSGPQVDNMHANIPLIEIAHEPSSIITEGSSGQINIQADIQIMESSSESSWITTEDSSGPPNKNNIQADIPFVELSYEPLSKTTEGPSDQLNVQAYMPVMDCPSEPLWISSEGSSGPQVDNIHANIPLIETSHEALSIITEGSTGQLDVQADIPLMESSSESLWINIKGSSRSQFDNTQDDMQFTESLSGSSFLLPESSTETQSINIQDESLSEPPSTTNKSCSGAQLNNVQADSPLREPPSVPSSLSTERSFGPQSDNVQAEAEPAPITLETCSGPQLNDVQGDTTEDSSDGVSPFLPTASSAEPQININQESALLLEFFSICTPCQSSGEPQGNNIQANIQSSPVLLLHSEISTKPKPENIQPIALPSPSSVSSSVQTTISSEFHPNYTLTDIPLMRSLPASLSPPTEGSSECQTKNIQSDIQLAELLPIPSSIPSKSPVELQLNDIQPKIVLGKSSPPPTESSTESQLVETDLSEQESPSTSSIVTTLCSPESQPNNNRSGAQSPKSMVAFAVPFTKNSESQSNYVQSAYLVQESSIPTNVSSVLQPNYMEVDILPLEPPPAPPTEAHLHYVQTDPPLTESSIIGKLSPIAIGSSAEPLPYNVHKDSSLTETSSGSSPPSTENIPESQPSNNNEKSPWLFSVPNCSAEESLLNTIQMEKTLTESAPVSTFPAADISDHDGKPNCSKFEVPSNEISLLPIPLLEDVLPNQFLPPCLPSDCSLEPPLRSSSPSCEMVYAEKVILFEDPHPGSPPVNGNLVVIESVPTDNPGELKDKLTGNVLDDVPVHDVPSSNNIIVAEDPVSDPKLIPSCEQLLKQFSNSSEALL